MTAPAGRARDPARGMVRVVDGAVVVRVRASTPLVVRNDSAEVRVTGRLYEEQAVARAIRECIRHAVTKAREGGR